MFIVLLFLLIDSRHVSKSVAAPGNRLHRAYVDILYAEKLINEATDVSQLDYVDAVLNHISLDGEEEEVGNASEYKEEEVGVSKKNYGYRCGCSAECVSHYVCRRAHHSFKYSDPSPPKCKRASLFRCRLNTWNRPNLDFSFSSGKGEDECTMEYMYPKYAEEMEEAMNYRKAQLIEQRKKMLEQKKLEEKKSVKPAPSLPIKLPMKGYYERCGASCECSGVFICRKAHHAYKFSDKNAPACHTLSFFRCRANTWRSPPKAKKQKVDECTIEYLKPDLALQVEEARRFRKEMLTQHLDANAGEVAITYSVDDAKEQLKALALERKKQTKWAKFAVKIFLKSAFIVLVGVFAAGIFASISVATLGAGAPLAAGVLLVGLDMMVAAGIKNAVCMGIDNFVEKGFEYLFEPPASQEEIALKALVDDFARDQESITTEMGKALKTADKKSTWFWGAFKKGSCMGLEFIFPEGSEVIAVTANLLEATGKALLLIAQENHEGKFWRFLNWFRKCIMQVTRPLWLAETTHEIFLITQKGVALRDSQIHGVLTECLGLDLTVYESSEERVGGGPESGGKIWGLSKEITFPEDEVKPQYIVIDETPLEQLSEFDFEFDKTPSDPTQIQPGVQSETKPILKRKRAPENSAENSIEKKHKGHETFI